MNHRVGCASLPVPGNILGGECNCKPIKVQVETNVIHTLTINLTERERATLQRKLKEAYQEYEGENGGIFKDIYQAIYHPEGANR